jgi:hypothetical protein
VTRGEIGSAVLAVIELVQEERRVPEGLVFAAFMGHLSADAFESMLQQIVRTGRVRRVHHDLVWVG